MQNYITTITQFFVKCKLYIFHIKTSQVKKIHCLYKSYIYNFLCHFYTLKATNFTQTYCFTIVPLILLKFCNIESL